MMHQILLLLMSVILISSYEASTRISIRLITLITKTTIHVRKSRVVRGTSAINPERSITKKASSEVPDASLWMYINDTRRLAALCSFFLPCAFAISVHREQLLEEKLHSPFDSLLQELRINSLGYPCHGSCCGAGREERQNRLLLTHRFRYCWIRRHKTDHP